jgi:hypothetical protein
MFFVFNDDCYVKKRKKVSFYSLVNVVLIPSRFEYNFFYSDLWWYQSDYTSFYTSANKELQEFVKKHPNMSFSNAKKILYQPNYVYDKFFFDGDTI